MIKKHDSLLRTDGRKKGGFAPKILQFYPTHTLLCCIVSKYPNTAEIRAVCRANNLSPALACTTYTISFNAANI